MKNPVKKSLESTTKKTKKQKLKESINISGQGIIPGMPLVPQIRWNEKVEPILIKIITELYSNHLTYNEIDTIVGLINTRTFINKIVPEAVGQVTAELQAIEGELQAERNKRRNEASYI